MKKILILLILLITGCASSEIDIKKDIYVSYIKELNKIEKTSKEIPFDIEIKYDKITENEIMYQVIIDNTTIDINDVEAIVVHNKETDDIFPSIGIFDEKEKLEVGKKPSGILLVGYIDYNGNINDFKCKMKVLIKYKTDKKEEKVYYVTKK